MGNEMGNRNVTELQEEDKKTDEVHEEHFESSLRDETSITPTLDIEPLEKVPGLGSESPTAIGEDKTHHQAAQRESNGTKDEERETNEVNSLREENQFATNDHQIFGQVSGEREEGKTYDSTNSTSPEPPSSVSLRSEKCEMNEINDVLSVNDNGVSQQGFDGLVETKLSSDNEDTSHLLDAELVDPESDPESGKERDDSEVKDERDSMLVVDIRKEKLETADEEDVGNGLRAMTPENIRVEESNKILDNNRDFIISETDLLSKDAQVSSYKAPSPEDKCMIYAEETTAIGNGSTNAAEKHGLIPYQFPDDTAENIEMDDGNASPTEFIVIMSDHNVNMSYSLANEDQQIMEAMNTNRDKQDTLCSIEEQTEKNIIADDAEDFYTVIGKIDGNETEQECYSNPNSIERVQNVYLPTPTSPVHAELGKDGILEDRNELNHETEEDQYTEMIPTKACGLLSPPISTTDDHHFPVADESAAKVEPTMYESEEDGARTSTESNPETLNIHPEMRKSPSFNVNLRTTEQRAENSDQTPLLHQDTNLPRILLSPSDASFKNPVEKSQNGEDPSPNQAIKSEEKGTHFKRSDSETSKAPFLGFLGEEEEDRVVDSPHEEEEGFVSGKNGCKELQNPTKRREKRKLRLSSSASSLFSSCICCASQHLVSG